MDWLKKLIETHTKDGKLDLEALNGTLSTEFPKHAVPKDTYNTLSEAKKQLEKDIATRDKQIEDLKKVDAAGLQAEIAKLQDENKSTKDKYEADMKDLTLTNVIKMALSGKVHDEAIVSGLVDRSKLVVDGDKVVGLEDQLKSLKESKSFLFKPDGATKPGFQVGNDGKGGTGAASNEQLSADRKSVV